MCVEVVGNSLNKTNTRFEFSYQNKNRDEQFEALGYELSKLEKIVPNGIVVAFSTYELMQKAMKFCLSLSKPVFFESKTENIDQVYAKYSKHAK